MKQVIATLAATAALSLAACSDAAVDETDGEVMTAEENTTLPSASEPVVVDENENDRDSVSISEDGVSADINDGSTSINADISDNPSLEVETD